MARVSGALIATSNYEVQVKKPLDARSLVPSYDDLTIKENWVKSGTTQVIAYNGMLVAVANISDATKNGLYMLFDINCTTPLKSPDVTVESNWIKIGDLSDVENRLSALEAIELPEGVTIEQVQAEVNVLREELTSAGYLTQDDLAEYALKTDVADAIADSKAYTDDALNDYVTSDVFTEEVSKLVTDQELEDAIKAIDHSTYATKEEVNAKLDASVYNTDKGSFALKDDLSYDKIANTPDLSVYAKAEDLEGKAATEHKHNLADIEDYETPDLSGYALQSDVPTKLSELENDSAFISAIPEEYVTEEELTNKGFLVSNDLADYAKKEDIPSLEGYIKEIPDEYVTESELQGKGYLTAVPEEYAKKSDIPDTSEFVNAADIQEAIKDKADSSTTLEGYGITNAYTKSEVDALLASTSGGISESEVDAKLEDYLTKFDAEYTYAYAKVTDIPVNVSELTNDAGFVNQASLDEQGYATKTWVEDKKYLTQHQDISNLATKDELAAEVQTLSENINKVKTDVEGSLSNYTTFSDVEDITKNFVTQSDVNTSISNLNIDNYAKKSDLDNYATKEDLESISEGNYFVTRDELQADYLNKTAIESTYASKVQLNDYALKSEIPSLDNVATKSDISTIESSIESLNADLNNKADKATTLEGYGITNTYTASQIDAKLAEVATNGKIDLDGYATKEELNAVGSRIDNINADVSGYSSQISALNTEVALIKTALTYGEF